MQASARAGRQRLLLVLRFSLYFLLILLGAGSIGRFIQAYGTRFFSEYGMLEWLHFGMLALTALLFLRLYFSDLQLRGLHIAMFAVAAVASARELDGLLDDLLPWGGWQLVAGSLLAVGGMLAVRDRGSLRDGLQWLIGQYSFALMWAGFVVAVPFVQFVGHKPFLRLLLPEQHVYDLRRYIEETGEWLGFLLILIAAIEIAICRHRRD